MLNKLIFFFFLLTITANVYSNAAPLEFNEINLNALNLKRFLFSQDTEEVEKPELDWNTIKYKTIDINTKEIEMAPKEFYKKVQDCIEKCQKTVNSDLYARDQCIAKTCDIY